MKAIARAPRLLAARTRALSLAAPVVTRGPKIKEVRAYVAAVGASSLLTVFTSHTFTFSFMISCVHGIGSLRDCVLRKRSTERTITGKRQGTGSSTTPSATL